MSTEHHRPKKKSGSGFSKKPLKSCAGFGALTAVSAWPVAKPKTRFPRQPDEKPIGDVINDELKKRASLSEVADAVLLAGPTDESDMQLMDLDDDVLKLVFQHVHGLRERLRLDLVCHRFQHVNRGASLSALVHTTLLQLIGHQSPPRMAFFFGHSHLHHCCAPKRARFAVDIVENTESTFSEESSAFVGNVLSRIGPDIRTLHFGGYDSVSSVVEGECLETVILCEELQSVIVQHCSRLQRLHLCSTALRPGPLFVPTALQQLHTLCLHGVSIPNNMQIEACLPASLRSLSVGGMSLARLQAIGAQIAVSKRTLSQFYVWLDKASCTAEHSESEIGESFNDVLQNTRAASVSMVVPVWHTAMRSAVAQLGPFTSVTHLELALRSPAFYLHGVQHYFTGLQSMRSLESLYISGSKDMLHSADVKCLADALQLLPNFHSLGLNNVCGKMSARGWRYLAGNVRCLRSLRLRWCPKLDLEVLMEWLKGNADTLQRLDIRNCEKMNNTLFLNEVLETCRNLEGVVLLNNTYPCGKAWLWDKLANPDFCPRLNYVLINGLFRPAADRIPALMRRFDRDFRVELSLMNMDFRRAVLMVAKPWKGSLFYMHTRPECCVLCDQFAVPHADH